MSVRVLRCWACRPAPPPRGGSSGPARLIRPVYVVWANEFHAISSVARCFRQRRRFSRESHGASNDGRRLRGGIPQRGVVEMGMDGGGLASAVSEQLGNQSWSAPDRADPMIRGLFLGPVIVAWRRGRSTSVNRSWQFLCFGRELM